MSTVDIAMFAPLFAAVPLAVLMAIFVQRRYPGLPLMKMADRAAWPGAILVCLGYWSVLLFLPSPSPEVAKGDQPMMVFGMILVGAPVYAAVIFGIGWAAARTTRPGRRVSSFRPSRRAWP